MPHSFIPLPRDLFVLRFMIIIVVRDGVVVAVVGVVVVAVAAAMHCAV